ncbi:MAG: hypothetical protein ACFFAS_05975 [Promethearchaeota archaeon]
MSTNSDNSVLYDRKKDIMMIGEFHGSIISKCRDDSNSVIFSDNITISETKIRITQGLKVGFENKSNKMIAFSYKADYVFQDDFEPLEYSVGISDEIIAIYDEGQFSDAFPYTINMLHTAGLYFNDYSYGINHFDFFKGEILKNPVAVIENGICVADRVVIDHRGDPVFYDCLIIGRDQKGKLSVTYEPLVNVDDKLVQYIIILGIENLKE